MNSFFYSSKHADKFLLVFFTSFFTGIGVLLIGLVLLFQHSESLTLRQRKVRAYNRSVKHYKRFWGNDIPTGLINNEPIKFNYTPVEVLGDTNDVAPAFTEYVFATSLGTRYFDADSITNVHDFRAEAVSFTDYEDTLYCDPKRYSPCTMEEIELICIKQHEYNARFKPHSKQECQPGTACGTCWWRRYLTEVCLVVDRDGQLSKRYQSCYYPFTNASYIYKGMDEYADVKVFIRPEDDPFVVLQDLSNGSRSFGPKDDLPEEESNLELVLLGAGGGLITVAIGGLIYLATYNGRDACNNDYHICNNDNSIQTIIPTKG